MVSLSILLPFVLPSTTNSLQPNGWYHTECAHSFQFAVTESFIFLEGQSRQTPNFFSLLLLYLYVHLEPHNSRIPLTFPRSLSHSSKHIALWEWKASLSVFTIVSLPTIRLANRSLSISKQTIGKSVNHFDS